MPLIHHSYSVKEDSIEPLTGYNPDSTHIVLAKGQSANMDLTRICPVCGAVFKPYRRAHIYCSEPCRRKSMYSRRKIDVGKIRKICVMCGKVSLIEGYHRSPRQKYHNYCRRCASILAHENHKKPLQGRTCAGCGKVFVSKNPRTHFCSVQCAYKHRDDAHRAKRRHEVAEHIRLCKTKHEFRAKYHSDSIFALKYKIEEYRRLPNGKRPKQIEDKTIITESKRYHTKKEYRNLSPNMYAIASRRGLLPTFTWLASEPSFHERYAVYRYFFTMQKAVYVGLSCDPRKRDTQHRIWRGKRTSCVFKFAKKSGTEIPEMEILESGISQSEARSKEHEYVNKYRGIGYKVLNTGKTGASVGSIGGMPKYTKKEFLEVAQEVGDFNTFVKNFKGLYIAALQHGWLKECHFLKRDRRAPKTINDEYAIKEADGKSTIEDLRNDSAIYNYIVKHKLWRRTKFGLRRQSLNKDFCISVARTFSSACSLRKSNITVYLKMKKNGWIEECAWLVKGEGRRQAAALKARPVHQMNKSGKILKTYQSIAVAARATNVSSGNLTSCLKGRKLSCGGFRWQYAD